MPPRLSLPNAFSPHRQPPKYLVYHLRTFSRTPIPQFPSQNPKSPNIPPPNAPLGSTREVHPLQDAPRSYGAKVDEFTPKPLLRPIGMNAPPTAGQNTGIDTRTLKQKREDYVNYQKHLEKRKQLIEQFSRPYFRDWSNLKHHAGKAWIAPPRPFRQDLSLFFPNFYGVTLDKNPRDTTPLLRGKASVVSVFSSMWGQQQVDSFMSKEANSELHQIVDQSQGKAQIVRINIEEDTLKAWMINWFKWSLRRKLGKTNWDKYFIVRRGITHSIRESIGLLNGKVGYTYIVDHECRIRWAGSGEAHEEERASLTKSLQMLLREMETPAMAPATAKQGGKPGE